MVLNDHDKTYCIDTLCRLVQIPSRSSLTGGQEGTYQRHVAEQMASFGADVRLVEADQVPGFFEHPLMHGPDRNYKDRPTVIAELGPADAPGLLVLAHGDTVQINITEPWSFDPFVGDVVDGKVRGLGASDDKWGTAVMLTVMRALQQRGVTLNKRLVFASTIDEENGVGNGTLLLSLMNLNVDGAFYLDASGHRVFVGNCGGSTLYLHSDITDEALKTRHFDKLTTACAAVSHQRSSLYDRPFYTTNPTRNESFRVIRPTADQSATFLIAFYTLPGEDDNTVKASLETMITDALGPDAPQYRISYRNPWFVPTVIPADTPMIGHLSDAIKTVLHREPEVTTIQKQDCFPLNLAGIPTVSYGSRSQIGGKGTFHQVDEAMPVNEVLEAAEVAYTAITNWLNA